MATKQIEVILNPKIGRFLRETRKRVNVIYGGAGSGKSYTIAQYLIIDKFLREDDKRIITVRKTLPALRITAYQLVLDLLGEYGIPFQQNKSEMTLFFKNNQWLFKSLDDPEKIKCFHPDTDILTDRGFKPVKDIIKGVRVATLDPKTREASYKPISKRWVYNYDGDMVKAGRKWRRIAFCVTPEHKLLGRTRRRKELRFIEAKDLPRRFYIPRYSRWDGTTPDFYKIEDFERYNQGKTTTFPIVPWLKFLGWYLSEGCLGEETRYMIYISQTKKEGKDEIRRVLQSFPYKFTENKRSFQLSGKALFNYLSQFGKCYQKVIPRDALDLHPDLLVHLFNALMMGDGTKHKSGRFTFSSTSHRLIDDVSELAIKLGYTPSVRKGVVTKYSYPNARPHWVISICKHIDNIIGNVESVQYKGKVYGFSVLPYHTVLARYNGRTMWCGQSYEGNYCWIEEATEVNHEDFLQLNLRLRRRTEGVNQMFLSFNPISKLNWIYTELIAKDNGGVGENHTTYLDNPFLDKEYIGELTGLVDVDETFHQVYALGQWGVLRNTIYSNYKIVDKFPKSFDEIIYGEDFGYNNPAALIEIGLKDNVPYLRERLYQSGLTTPELISRMDSLKIDKQAKIYGDSEDPNAIEQIFQAGYNIHSCRKGKGSVKSGIDHCKSRRFFVHQESANLIAELQSYKWKEDKNGNVLEEPVKFKDHLCDAFRMALWSHRHKPFQEIIVVDL